MMMAQTLPQLSQRRLDQIARLLADLSHEFPHPASALAVDLGVSQRRLRDIVRDARQHGLPIISGDDGYRLGRRDELERCALRLEAHAKQELARVSDLRRIARKAARGPGLWDRLRRGAGDGC